MKYPQHPNLNYAKVGETVLAYWKEHEIFEKSVSTREGKPSFTFYEGPPSANGTPGIHHVMARTIKDLFCRYKTLQGFQVKRKGGWDTHGLPIEIQVEKELGITKEDIGKKISIEDYNRKCREAVMKYTSQWNDLTERMGYWVDLENPYVTYQKEYIESVWHLLKQLYDKDLLYKGYTIQPYSPAAGTGLSSHELNMPGTYKDVKDTSIVAQFKVNRNEKSEFLFETSLMEDLYILAWTTTPWTLPANSALTVGKNIDYVKIRTFNAYTFIPISVILAKALVGKYFSEKTKELLLEDYKPGDKIIPYKIVAEYKGSDLEGVEYEQLLPYVKPDKAAFRVILGDFVTTEDGTGVVHTSPTFGADDYRVAQQNGIPSILVKDENEKEVPIVDKQGRFVKEIGLKLQEGVAKYGIKTHKPLGSRDFYVKNYTNEDESSPDYKNTDVIISIILKEENKAFKVEKYEHTYPHCWRTDKPVLYYPLDSWFIRTTAMKDRLIELNKTINWKPENTGTGRFGNWLENLVDWNLSRSRYWGTPLPIWRTEEGKEESCIGSIKQLEEEISKANLAGFKNPSGLEDLHRPYVDDIVLVSPSGKPMYREPDLIDVWFDSGSMPYAQWHYPFENQEVFAKNFPADFISEGVDQTRGWFFTLHAIAGLLFDSVAFKNVVSTGLVLDKNGEKMSKSKGNAVNPFETIATYGPDATRWYLIANAPPWDNLKFNLDGILEVQRKFFGTLQNTYNFFALYANLDKFKFTDAQVPLTRRTESDRWIISRLNSLVFKTQTAYDEYEPTRVARAIQDFVADDLSNWYVRLNRKRFWKTGGRPGEYNEDKQAAYQTLHTCLETVARLMSPIAPFYAEQLYRDLVNNTAESVHLSEFPKVEQGAIDQALEEKMTLAQNISSLIHSLRKKHSLKVRQPLSRVLIPVLNPQMRQQIQDVEDLILSEVNIKSLEYIDDTSGVVVKKIKPNFKTLGPKFGKQMKHVAAVIQNLSQHEIAELEKEGFKEFTVEDLFVKITLEDVEITSEDIPGWIVVSENGLTVALDITLTDDLRREGIARDVVNRVQNLRKDMGLEVQDKIKIDVQLAGRHPAGRHPAGRHSADELINSALIANREYICQETQALELNLLAEVEGGRAVEMDEFVLNLKITVSN